MKAYLFSEKLQDAKNRLKHSRLIVTPRLCMILVIKDVKCFAYFSVLEITVTLFSPWHIKYFFKIYEKKFKIPSDDSLSGLPSETIIKGFVGKELYL